MQSTLEKNIANITTRSFYVFSLAYLFVCRLLAMYFLPLNDTTESRYGEIARKMLETGNWVTPLHDYNEPFWAKPPLSTWLSAFSMKLFGVNEFAVRFPAFLLSLAVLYLVWKLAKRQSNQTVAWNAILLLSASFYFILDAGVVMTDPSLLFSITLCMVSFWFAVIDKNKLWSYLFFVGLGLGLLAKGPIAIVLTGLPLFFWVVIRKQWAALWQNLPWITGSLLTLAIALPWYLLAEHRTPGFINYFIVGEHFKRFLEPSWHGDKYGTAHVARLGMIWFYAFLGFLPWSIIGLPWLARNIRKLSFSNKTSDGWLSYIVLFILMPLIFFTFAHNVIYTYVFPVMPAFALLIAELSYRYGSMEALRKQLVYTTTAVGAIFLGAVLLFQLFPQAVAKTQKPVIAAWKKQHPSSQSQLIYWTAKPLYSAQFYSKGKIKALSSTKAFCSYLSNHPDQSDHFIITNKLTYTPFPDKILSQSTVVDSIKVVKDEFTIYKVDVKACA